MTQTESPFPVEELQAEDCPSEATEYRVRMRDGVHLATDVYLPDGWTSGPAILVRLPYDKRSSYVYFTRAAELFTRGGYALVVQDVRGKYGSEGETLAYVNETADGYDTIEWVVNQPWSDGAIGMFGDSYYGFTQWAAVASEHPALRAIVPRVTGTGIGSRAPRMNPDGRSRRVRPMHQSTYLASIWSGPLSYHAPFTERPLEPRQVFEDFFATIGRRSSYFDITRMVDPPLRVFRAKHPYQAKPLPVLHVAGWFDNVKNFSFDDYLHLSRRPGWGPLQYLWVDSMDHEGYRLPDAPIQPDGDHLLSDAAMTATLERYVGPALEFFDVFVKEIAPASSIPRVRWHLSHGADVLNEGPEWPPANVTMDSYALTEAPAATASAEGGRLVRNGTADGTSVVWAHDPARPVPSNTRNMYAMLYDYADQQHIGDRPDVLTFTADPFDDDTDFAGGISATLKVEASTPSADVVVKLLDVGPDGGARLVAWGDAEIAADRGPVEFSVDLGQIGYRYRSGHAIRLQISASEYPWFFVNPGTGESVWEATEYRPSSLTLMCDTHVALHMPRIAEPLQ